MEKSFDLGSVMKQYQKKHKGKPMQFESVAGGKARRMENCIKLRKSSRLTSFDCTRNLSLLSPVPVSEAQQKAESRRQQLQKWKEEKERKKKESAAKKLKPFITGVPHNSIKYVPPPPPKSIPSSSGRVTRSQSVKNQKDNSKKLQMQSFAPNNAGFQAPQIKNLKKLPALEPVQKKKDKDVLKFKFQPVVSTTISSITTRSQAYQKIVIESRAKMGKTEVNIKGRIVKPVSKLNYNSKVIQSSSSSENELPMQYSPSSGDVDLAVRIVSSSEDSNILSSTEIDSSKSIQSSSSCEFVAEEQPISKRKSLPSALMTKTVTLIKSSPNSNTAKESKLNTPRNSIPKSESSSEERLRSPKSPINLPMTPEQLVEEFKKISPCVTLSRGKENARREMKKKIEEGLLDEDCSDIESVEYFERQLASEIKRMSEICDVWDKINEQVTLSESVQGLVLGAVGQARLLMSQKMQQFARLVERCARPEPGTTLVTPADLRGFWDMVFLQVENVDMRFKELEELKARNWVEKTAPVAAASRKPRARPAVPLAKPRAAPSRLRDMIAAARKAKAQVDTQSTVSDLTSSTESQPEERTFEAGFFTVRSPARSPHTPATPRSRQSLLKAVLSSEAEKASASKKSASFAMLRASVLGKNVECEGVAPLPQTPVHQINLQATPGRSILKNPQESVNKSIKQIKVVLFHEIDNEMNKSTENLKLSKEQVEVENAAAEKVDLPKEQTENTENVPTPMDIDGNSKTKRNSRRSTRLTRQNALVSETAPPMTRKMQKYMEELEKEQKTPKSEQNTGKKTTKRSTRKKEHSEVESIETPQEQEMQEMEVKSQRSEKQRRSSRKNVLAEVDLQLPQTGQKEQVTEEKSQDSVRPRRSSRKSVLGEAEMQTPQAEKRVQEIQQTINTEKQKRSSRNKVLAEVDIETQNTEQKFSHSVKKISKRSTRRNTSMGAEDVLKENVTPIRSMRSRKTDTQAD